MNEEIHILVGDEHTMGIFNSKGAKGLAKELNSDNSDYNFELFVIEVGNKASIIDTIAEISGWDGYVLLTEEEWDNLH